MERGNYSYDGLQRTLCYVFKPKQKTIILGFLIKIQTLRFRFEELPACLYELPLVEIIIAANNKINCVDVKGLEKLTMLAVLDLRNNSISHIPPELGLLTQLRYVVVVLFYSSNV